MSSKKYVIDAIRILEKKYNTSIGILGDIQGPKIRIGTFEKNENNAHDSNTFVELKEGDTFVFDLLDIPGNQQRVFLNYPLLLKNVKPGQIILLDDGNLKMKVIENRYDPVNVEQSSVKVKVITGGKLYSKKGFCIPNMIIPIEVLNETDIKNVLFCLNEQVDFLGYSFVQTKYDLIFLKNIINDYYNSDFYQNKKKDRINFDIKNLIKKDQDDPNDFFIKEVNDYYQNYYLKNYEKYTKVYDAYKTGDLKIDSEDDVYDTDNYNNNDDKIDEGVLKTQHQKSHSCCSHHIHSNDNTYSTTTDYSNIHHGKTKTYMNEINNINKDNTNDIERIFIISKIEKPAAVKNINSIIELSDGIMIARGDLGIETNLSNLPVLQKKLINLCRIKYNKPVIVATQMLESMRFFPTPTRAEVTDVATALYDGADCVMLSAETATGNYPTLTAATQNSIIKDVEKDYYY
uniref:Pyruvate kinase n=1 Tax=Piliocolobus tephrosceles TaxID=591936 RepID=A0A8C9GEH8_9PRIM